MNRGYANLAVIATLALTLEMTAACGQGTGPQSARAQRAQPTASVSGSVTISNQLPAAAQALKSAASPLDGLQVASVEFATKPPLQGAPSRQGSGQLIATTVPGDEATFTEGEFEADVAAVDYIQSYTGDTDLPPLNGVSYYNGQHYVGSRYFSEPKPPVTSDNVFATPAPPVDYESALAHAVAQFGLTDVKVTTISTARPALIVSATAEDPTVFENDDMHPLWAMFSQHLVLSYDGIFVIINDDGGVALEQGATRISGFAWVRPGL